FNPQSDTMNLLSSLIHYMTVGRAPTRQKQTALQMLVVSGVVRSSHIELHYETPFARMIAYHAQPTPTLGANISETSSPSSLREAGTEELPSVHSHSE